MPETSPVRSPRRAGEPVLKIEDLVVEFATDDGVVHAVDHVSYDISPGETLGIVGESGSGKSVTVMSILGLIPQPPGRITNGSALFRGFDLIGARESELRQIRGKDIAMVFQDPMTSLNPVFKVGEQIAEAIQAHDSDVESADARDRSIQLLELVGVPNAKERFDQHPHEYSGGMRQRAMIAMAIANQPALLIADEPTTALDVTIQAQILEVLKTAQRETQAATILITHDLGLIAEMADRVVVMYAGHVVETGDVETIFHEPRHPYTLGLMDSLPRVELEHSELRPIPGQPPSLISVPSGCPFHPRCRLYQGREICRQQMPPLEPEERPDHLSACHFSHELRGAKSRVIEEAAKSIS